MASELFRIIPLIFSLIRRPFTSPDDEFEVPSMPYHKDVPRVLFFGLLGITYFFLAPLILPFLLAYLCLAYIIFRNQVSISLDVYSDIYLFLDPFFFFFFFPELILCHKCVSTLLPSTNQKKGEMIYLPAPPNGLCFWVELYNSWHGNKDLWPNDENSEVLSLLHPFFIIKLGIN